jgi:hypothetical protein
VLLRSWRFSPNTFYSDLDRSNDRIEAAQQAKSAKTNYCYLPVPTWATPEFCFTHFVLTYFSSDISAFHISALA